MAQPVYSTRFLSGHNPVGEQIFIVPTGYTAVVRDLDVTAPPSGGYNVLLFVAGLLIFIAQYGLEPQFTNTEWRGRAVVREGEEIGFTATDDVDFQLSGYLLINS